MMLPVTLGGAVRMAVRLLDAAGDPVVGKVFGDITCYISKAGAPEGVKAVTSPDWIELGSHMPGCYSLAILAADTSALGVLTVCVTCTGCDPFTDTLLVGPTPTEVSALIGTPVTSVSADLAAVAGNASAAAASASSADGKLGSPVVSVSADLAATAVLAGTAATKATAAAASAAAVQAVAPATIIATAADLAELAAALGARAPLLVSAVLLPPASMAVVPASDGWQVDWSSAGLRRLGYQPLVAGDNWAARVQLFDEAGDALDLTDALLVLEVQTSATDATVLLTRRSDVFLEDPVQLQIEPDTDQTTVGGTLTAPTGRGCLTIHFGHEEVNDVLAAAGLRPFGLRLETAAGVVTTRLRGKLEIVAPVPTSMDDGSTPA
jgi:hypothetical protein